MKDILDIGYLFDPTPKVEPLFLYYALAIFVLTIAAGYLYKNHLRKNKHDQALKKTMRNVPKQLVLTGLIGLFYIFSLWQRLPYLSMVFVGILLLLVLTIILLKAIYKFKKVYPLEFKQHLKTAQSAKYLPRRKK